MGELVGLGLRGIGKSEINIDLVPGVVEQIRAADRRKPFFIAAAAVLICGVGAWAAFQNAAATKAQELALTMKEQRDNLAPFKTQIDGLLKQESALRQIADSYTNTESDHAFWMDTLSELSGAFASEFVWLTDFEPIHGYDAAKALDPTFDPEKSKNGTSIIKSEFRATAYGSSSMVDIEVQKPAQGRNKRGSAPSTEITANAVKIKGFWRENPKSANLVSELLKNLSDKSVAFSFKIPNPKNSKQTINLVDDQNLGKIMTITSVSTKGGDLAQPFEITLPLAREVVIK